MATAWQVHQLRGKPSGDVQPARKPMLSIPNQVQQITGPFSDTQQNEVWAAFAAPLTDWEALLDLDCLEPDPKTRKAAMSNNRLKPFWMGAEQKEIIGPGSGTEAVFGKCTFQIYPTVLSSSTASSITKSNSSAKQQL